MKPMEIEKRSFEIIQQELGDRKLDPEYDLLIRRVIHTTADFEYVDTLAFSEHAMRQLMNAMPYAKEQLSLRMFSIFGAGVVSCLSAGLTPCRVS